MTDVIGEGVRSGVVRVNNSNGLRTRRLLEYSYLRSSSMKGVEMKKRRKHMSASPTNNILWSTDGTVTHFNDVCGSCLEKK